jgi:hypothetical protein
MAMRITSVVPITVVMCRQPTAAMANAEVLRPAPLSEVGRRSRAKIVIWSSSFRP